jgi:hypothetical protein
MKLRLTTLLIAIVLTGSMAAAVHVYGAHSTPGIRLMVANLPGIAFGLWATSLIREDPGLYPVLYVVCSLVNWAFYFYLVKAALLLKRRFLN